VISELQDSARRFEQQITAFEKLHVDEMKRFQEQFGTLQRLQSDELQMLRDELQRLKAEIEALRTQELDQPREDPPPEMPLDEAARTLTRRELITGNIHPHPSGRV
jgi:hypothetical protein